MDHPRKSRDGNEELERANSAVSRKRSLIKPERRRLGKDDPGYYYTLAAEEGNVSTMPSSTGNDPRLIASNSHMPIAEDRAPIAEDEEGRTEIQKQESFLSRKLSQLHRGDSRRSFNRQASSASRASRRSHASKATRASHVSQSSGETDSMHSVAESAAFTGTPGPSGETAENGVATETDKNGQIQFNERSQSGDFDTSNDAALADSANESEIGPKSTKHTRFDTYPEIPLRTDRGEGELSDEAENSFESADETSSWVKKSPIMSKEQTFNPWKTYCLILTAPVIPLFLRVCGLKTPDRQMAWREKIGLISVILLCGLFVGYLTFGFTQTVCSNTAVRIKVTDLNTNELLISGDVYDFGEYAHPAVEGISENSPIMYPPVNAGGKDGSFMFQNVNGACKGLITPKADCQIPYNDDQEVGWYYPCQLLNLNNFTLVNNSDIANSGADIYSGWGCHTYSSSRTDLYSRKRSATVYYTWDDLWYNSSQQLVTYNGDVLNLDYLDFLLTDDLDYPAMFDSLRTDLNIRGRDLSQEMSYGENRKIIACLREITKVGEIDTDTIGCIASKVVLYVSLVFIMGLVIIKFLFACYFRFVIARKQGAFEISENQFKQRERQIEDWGNDIYTSAQNFQNYEHFPDYESVRSRSPVPPSGFQTPGAAPGSSGLNISQSSVLATPNLNSGGVNGPFSGFGGVPDSPSTANTTGTAMRVGVQPDRRSSLGNMLTSSTASTASGPFSDKHHSVIFDKLKPRSDNRVSNVTMGTQNRHVSSSKVISGQSLQKHPLVRHSVVDGRSTLYSQFNYSNASLDNRDLAEPNALESYSLTDLPPPSFHSEGLNSPSTTSSLPSGPLGGNSEYLVPQPPVDYQPFGYPLIHVMCMVTAYSESIEGLRTTLDSICTTEYPNSHQLIAIVCDGLVKGSGNDMTTPEICLSMMTDLSVPEEDVEAYSYVSVVSGRKRHNMAKVYAGFYKYDDDTVPLDKQQRVPVICIVKCGTAEEAGSAKPGNRGKRDSQIILMSFLQRVMFDERMTELEFEIFQGIRSVTGIAPDFYELLLMVDADTKVFPDCLTHMCAEMVKDPEIMGLCGETKIANKRDSWVTMIQVFEYFISHHQAKAFESVFGGVTCLPGCFSIYRIRAPKGEEGYWVPILCNPDIVERYSDNAINTLHSKNLLLLGEDRYLSTLMLRTFPKRKMVFVPKAACKTIVPDEFKVLLSQRRRWINSTIHNLFELLLVRDLCGVFIISMQFVVFIDLISTLVLPAAIAFTLYIIIIAIVKRPVPILSLILLAMILGLPGVLVVVTATRASYLLWMLIYLLALPIWNFVLPMYAYWHFDDFSWGNTREVVGGNKAHDDAEGEFDSSHIIMKRWREFQADRERMAFAY